MPAASSPTCPGCGYDLRGLTTTTCPECGRPTTAHDIAIEIERRQLTRACWAGLFYSLIVMLAFALAVAAAASDPLAPLALGCPAAAGLGPWLALLVFWLSTLRHPVPPTLTTLRTFTALSWTLGTAMLILLAALLLLAF